MCYWIIPLIIGFSLAVFGNERKNHKMKQIGYVLLFIGGAWGIYVALFIPIQPTL